MIEGQKPSTNTKTSTAGKFEVRREVKQQHRHPQPSTINQQPTTINQQPSTNNQQPITPQNYKKSYKSNYYIVIPFLRAHRSFSNEHTFNYI
jgi:hypothetical protein